MEIEHRAALSGAVEIRDGGRVGGVCMTYGDRATIGRGVSEVFLPGSLKPSGDTPPRVVNGHGGATVALSPDIDFGEKEVRLEFDAPPEVRSRVASGELGHFSIEFVSRAERFHAGRMEREIREATLVAVALVTNPAYRSTKAEARGQTADGPDNAILGLL